MFAAFSNLANAQDYSSEVDSLTKVLAKQTDDTNKVNTLNQLAYYYSLDDYENTMQNVNKAFSLAKDLGFKSGIANAYLNFGLANGIIKNESAQLDDYLKALNLYKRN